MTQTVKQGFTVRMWSQTVKQSKETLAIKGSGYELISLKKGFTVRMWSQRPTGTEEPFSESIEQFEILCIDNMLNEAHDVNKCDTNVFQLHASHSDRVQPPQHLVCLQFQSRSGEGERKLCTETQLTF